jgi:hypothetical protein
MWRYFVGAAAGVMLVAGGVLAWQNVAIATHRVPPLPARLVAPAADEAGADDPVPDPPAASEKTKEQKRFSRYDRDRNGTVSRDEFLAARRKNFAKLDLDGNGQLSFDEYAVKGEQRFAGADADKSGALDAAEFATTRVQRKAHASPRCPPPRAAGDDDQG